MKTLVVDNKPYWTSEFDWVTIIVGGDFNSCVKLDIPKDTGNREILKRMNDLGLTELSDHLPILCEFD